MELLRALAVLAESPSEETAGLARVLNLDRPPTAAEHTDLFVFQLVPYASVYLGAEGMLGGEAEDRVRGFWLALGHAPPTEPDHLAALLGLYVRLSELEEAETDLTRRAALGRARAALLFEHLMSWQPAFLEKAIEIGPSPFRDWGRLLKSALVAEAASLSPPDVLPLHLREAPGLPNKETASLDELVSAILAPVRCGMVLTRSDLQRAGRELGLGVRAGGRRFVLGALLEQDATAIMDWLGAEAERWTGLYHSYADSLGSIATFWANRASQTASFAAQLSRTARAIAIDP